MDGDVVNSIKINVARNIFLLIILAPFWSAHSQDSINYMIETSDEVIFLMWERLEENTPFIIFRYDSSGVKEQLNSAPIVPLYNRMQLERLFGKDTKRLCKDFGVRFPEQIRNEIRKKPEYFYIFQAVEPRLSIMFGNGYFDYQIINGKGYRYEVSYIDDAGRINGYFKSPEVLAKDRPPAPPDDLKGKISNYNDVELYWRDTPENRHAGYNVYRSEFSDGPFEKINSKRVLIFNSDYYLNASQYNFLDENVDPGRIYFYKVLSINILGKESMDSDIIKMAIPEKPNIDSPVNEKVQSTSDL